jgi:hypothetical protein
MADELLGFKVGDQIEARHPAKVNRPWMLGKVNMIDTDDISEDAEAFYIIFDGDSTGYYVDYHTVRKPGETGKAKTYEYRRIGGSGMFANTGSDWSPLNLQAGAISINVPANASSSKIEIRVKPDRTADEIVKKLRDFAYRRGIAAEARKILDGDF